MNIRELNEELEKILGQELLESNNPVYVYAGYHQLIVSKHKIARLTLMYQGTSLEDVMEYIETSNMSGDVVYTKDMEDDVVEFFGTSVEDMSTDFVDL